MAVCDSSRDLGVLALCQTLKKKKLAALYICILICILALCAFLLHPTPTPPFSLSLWSAMLFQRTFLTLAQRQTKYSDWYRQRSPITNYKSSRAAAAAAAGTKEVFQLFTDNEPRANWGKKCQEHQICRLESRKFAPIRGFSCQVSSQRYIGLCNKMVEKSHIQEIAQWE